VTFGGQMHQNKARDNLNMARAAGSSRRARKPTHIGAQRNS